MILSTEIFSFWPTLACKESLTNGDKNYLSILITNDILKSEELARK